MKKYKDISFSKNFLIESGKTEYEFKMKKTSYWWIWILCLIAFLLLCCVKCEHSIDVKTVDINSGEELVCDSVTIEYTSHYLYKDGRLFVKECHSITKAPDEDGIVHFCDMPCSIFSYIFYAFSYAEYTINNQCYVLSSSPQTGLFHYKWTQTLGLSPKTSHLTLTVTDRETEEPLADALLKYSYIKSGETITDSIKSDAAGKCNLSGVPTCGNINIVRVSCYAYEDTTNISILVEDAIHNDKISSIPLTPIKESFTFFVQNKYTHQPIPDAKVELILKDKNNVVRHGPISTNTYGTGRGAYKDIFVGASLELRASKENYKDSIYTPICTVDSFIRKPDNLRIIYLEPLPSLHTFVNADSISHQPIEGVTNDIVVKSIDGNEYRYEKRISNINGIFEFVALEGDKIVIDSKNEPQYKPKHTEIAKFEKEDTILMKPNFINLTFRTIVGSSGNLLPDCQLTITTTKSGIVNPATSGNGVFTVYDLLPNEKISIASAKQGYETNDYTISNFLVSDLQYAPDDWRNIPMNKEMLPCDGGKIVPKKGKEKIHTQTYNLGQSSGHTSITLDFKRFEDFISVYDGPDTTYPCLINRKEIPNKDLLQFDFHNGCITVVVETGPKGDESNWEYQVNCPN